MEILKSRYESLQQALDTLDQALQVLQDPQYEAIYNNLRDSSIQRFEYSIDGVWKYLKLYMQEKNELQFESTTPRNILREALNANLINEEEYINLLKALSDRNETSHSYNELVAENLVKKIPGNYLLMKKIVDRLTF